MSFPGLPPFGLDYGNAGDRGAFHQRERIGQRRVGKDGDRIDDHPAFEPLDLADLLGLIGGLEIAVDDPDPAGFRHRDREPRLGDGVHGRREDRQVETDGAGELRPDIRCARHHRAMAGAQENVVEGEAFGNKVRFNDRHRHASYVDQTAEGARLASAAWRGCLTWARRSS